MRNCGGRLACVDLAGGPPLPDTRNERGRGARTPRPRRCREVSPCGDAGAPPTCVNTWRAALWEDDGITDASSTERCLPPGHIFGGIDVPADVSAHAHSLDVEGAQHPAHPHATDGPEGSHGLVEGAAQRTRTIDTHEVLIERLRITTAHDTPITALTQRRFEEGGQESTYTGSIDGHNDDEDVVTDAQRVQAGVDTGQRAAARRILKGTQDTVGDAHGRRHNSHAPCAARLHQDPAHAVDQAHATQNQIRLRDATQALSPAAADDDRGNVSARSRHGPQPQGAKVSTSARCVAASIMRTRPISGSPKPTSTLIASVAMAVPA